MRVAFRRVSLAPLLPDLPYYVSGEKRKKGREEKPVGAEPEADPGGKMAGAHEDQDDAWALLLGPVGYGWSSCHVLYGICSLAPARIKRGVGPSG